jgi:SAM-dependent methyltransferase
MTAFGSDIWDERYRAMPSVWGAAPNRWVEQELADLPPGTALDLACGEGRNAIWLSGRGWRVIGVDFSPVAVQKAADAERHAVRQAHVEWVVGDATTYAPPAPVDLVVICYLQLPAALRRAAVRCAAASLAAGGTLLVVGHDTRNLADGMGGPQDAAVLFTAADLEADLAGTGLTIEKGGEVLRPVEGAPRPAIDALVRAVRVP